MTFGLRQLPAAVIIVAAVALLVHGPIAQWPDYHRFADTRMLLGLPNALDVASNLGFVLVGLWGIAALAPRRHDARLARSWPGWCLFLIALVLTGVGSAYYHLAPDDLRLVFDRVPIALACAGLLAAYATETYPALHRAWTTGVLAAVAVASVLYWYWTEIAGAGDLRPYLLMQVAPLVLIPLWQTIGRAARAERLAIACAIVGYGLARAAEMRDSELLQWTGVVSGHTLKHLLATASAAIIISAVVTRLRARGTRAA